MPPENGTARPEAGCIAVVGATGAVGREVLHLLAARGVPAEQVRAIASARSAGTRVPYGRSELGISGLDEGSFAGCALAVFAADAVTARRFAPIAAGAGAVVIDNSSAFRLDPDVPLVVPEVDRRGAIPAPRNIIANPNCTTIILVTALEPLRRAFGIEAIDLATYQAVSGAGLAAIDELLEDTRASLDPPDRPSTEAPRQRVFAEPAAFNVFSHDSPVDPRSGVNGEEQKVIDETRKIWGDPSLRITPTCVRVPVLRAHTEAITVTLASAASEAEVREALARGSGVVVVDDRAANRFPTPRKASGNGPVLVGRVRPDPGEVSDAGGRNRRWCLLACGDQLLKGAALNAVQIAERLGLVPHESPDTVPAGGERIVHLSV
ncbi:MAG: aspartate-semialdehyde dehydrogenase [Phycisphaerales bacterium JB054]